MIIVVIKNAVSNKRVFCFNQIAFFFCYCFIAIPAFGQQQKDKIPVTIIDGKIQNFGNGSLIGTIWDIKTKSFQTDTIVIKNNVFTHSVSVTEKQVVSYKADDKFATYRNVFKDGDTANVDFTKEKSRSIEVVLSVGSRIKVVGVAGKYLEAYPSGTKENDQLAALNKKITPLSNRLSNLDYTDKNNIRATIKAEDSLSSSISDLEFLFVKDNPSSIISSYIIWKKFEATSIRNPVKADSLLKLLHPIEKDVYQQRILLIQQNRTMSNSSIAIGDMFPNFSSKMVYGGAVFDLDQTRGKYTLIDFWGTWCVPCIREMPRLKAYYEKYQNKLNVVGIAGRDQYQNWKAFLDKNSYGWTQILDDIPKLSDKLNVRVYPTKYLLDTSGKIVMIFKDANEDVWKKLDTLLSSGNQ